jgi:hypothetical protein
VHTSASGRESEPNPSVTKSRGKNEYAGVVSAGARIRTPQKDSLEGASAHSHTDLSLLTKKLARIFRETRAGHAHARLAARSFLFPDTLGSTISGGEAGVPATNKSLVAFFSVGWLAPPWLAGCRGRLVATATMRVQGGSGGRSCCATSLSGFHLQLPRKKNKRNGSVVQRSLLTAGFLITLIQLMDYLANSLPQLKIHTFY